MEIDTQLRLRVTHIEQFHSEILFIFQNQSKLPQKKTKSFYLLNIICLWVLQQYDLQEFLYKYYIGIYLSMRKPFKGNIYNI